MPSPPHYDRPSLDLRRSLTLVSCFVWLVLVAGLLPAQAQVFQLSGGSSSLFQAHGGSVEIRAANYEGWVGVGGSLGKPQFGGFLRTEFRGYKLGFGDDAIPFRLPTDLFNTSHYFLARGVGLTRLAERVSLFGFVGATTTGVATPFFRGARFEKGAGLLFLEAPLTPRLRFFSHNVVSDRQTTIHGVDWQPHADIRASVAGGMGANQGYFASSVSADRNWVAVKATYVRAGDNFRRITVQTPLSSEVADENILVTLRPQPYLTFHVGRQNFLQPASDAGKSLRGTLNQYAASLNVAQIRFSGVVFDSRAPGARNLGSSLLVGRNFADRVQADGGLLYNRPSRGPSLTTLIATVREPIFSRLSLLQLITYSDGHGTVSFGGNFLTNRITIGIEYQTIYVPFQTGNPFKQALMLNLRLQPFGNYQINAGTHVGADGKVRYTAHGTTFLYRDGGIYGGAPSPGAGITLHKNIVQGRVVDEAGNPLEGAALQIDGEVVYTNSEGRFFARKAKARSYRFEVLLDEFLVLGQFEVVSAPTTVNALPEDRAPEITIILRRLQPAAPNTARPR